jgi:hypothetical protein
MDNLPCGSEAENQGRKDNRVTQHSVHESGCSIAPGAGLAASMFRSGERPDTGSGSFPRSVGNHVDD